VWWCFVVNGEIRRFMYRISLCKFFDSLSLSLSLSLFLSLVFKSSMKKGGGRFV